MKAKTKRKYYQTYKLLKDTIDFPTGWLFSWEGMRRLYYPHQPRESYHGKEHICSPYSEDLSKGGYGIDYMESHPEWFQPVGKPKDFYPDFPSEARIADFADLELTTRLVDSVDEARCLNELFYDEKFKKRLYRFIKEQYEAKYF